MFTSLLALTGAAFVASASARPATTSIDTLAGCDGTWKVVPSSSSLNDEVSMLRCEWHEPCQPVFSYEVSPISIYDEFNVIAFKGIDCVEPEPRMEKNVYFRPVSKSNTLSVYDIEVHGQASKNFCVALECDNVDRPCSQTTTRVKVSCAPTRPLERQATALSAGSNTADGTAKTPAKKIKLADTTATTTADFNTKGGATVIERQNSYLL